jgi:16S rRNA (uracil1498-N3)-methyltransferase
LPAAEVHHARHVLRLRAGDELEVFDGVGHAVRCRLGADGAPLTPLHHSITPPLPVRLTLAVAVIKKNMDFLVQKATELGVAAIVPLVTGRTVARPPRSDRWREIALEACKQCGNNWLPEITAPQPFADWLRAPGNHDVRFVAALQPDARPVKECLPAKPVSAALLLIGPEGDFTATEYAAARAAGCVPVTLGPLVLRADTAALYALSVLHHELIVSR